MAVTHPSTPRLDWRKREVPPTSLRAQKPAAGDPLFDWMLCGPDGDELVLVRWDERHGWDAYSLITGGYLSGKWDGPDQAYEDERLAKRAAERHAIARLTGADENRWRK